jgi:hypothetical protein
MCAKRRNIPINLDGIFLTIQGIIPKGNNPSEYNRTQENTYVIYPNSIYRKERKEIIIN